MVIMWMVPTAADRYRIGCHNEKKYPPITKINNTTQYLQILPSTQ